MSVLGRLGGRRPRRVAVGVAVVLAVAAALWAVPPAGADTLRFGGVTDHLEKEPKQTGAADGSVTIGWTEDADGATGYLYHVWIKGQSGFIAEDVDIGLPTSLSHTITGLTNGTVYKVSVVPYIKNSSGTITKRGASVTFDAEPNVAPNAPTNLRVAARTPTKARLTFRAPSTDNVGYYQMRIGTAGRWARLWQVDVRGNDRTADSGGFTANTTHQVYVRSVNTAGVSAAVGPTSVTTPPVYTGPPPHDHGEVASKTSGCTDRPGAIAHWEVKYHALMVSASDRAIWDVYPGASNITGHGTSATCNNPESFEIWYAKAATVGTDAMTAKQIMTAQRVSGTTVTNNELPTGTTASHVSRYSYNFANHAPLTATGPFTVAGAGNSETEFCFMVRVNIGEVSGTNKTVGTASQRGQWSTIGCVTINKNGSEAVFDNNCLKHASSTTPSSPCTLQDPTET